MVHYRKYYTGQGFENPVISGIEPVQITLDQPQLWYSITGWWNHLKSFCITIEAQFMKLTCFMLYLFYLLYHSPLLDVCY